MDFKDYYKTLGVQPNASLETIRTAYRKLSKKFHPDVNSGDKFFEEKFKEIQEAYEILSDTSKRKQYDYKKANFNKSNNYNNQEHEDNLRKKEEELRRQKEDFKKWEDSLKKKEEILKEREKQKEKKPTYIIVVLLLVTTSISLVYLTVAKNQTNTENPTIVRSTADTAFADISNNDNSKQPLLQTKKLNGKTYEQDAKGDWYEVSSTSTVNSSSSTNKTLNIDFANSELAKTIDGIWTGNAYQYDVKESWAIKFTCNSKKGTFLIEYPSLGCNGNLSIENMTNNEIEFRENIQKGFGTCNNNGLIKLKRINNKKFVYLYYLPNSSDINAKGQIFKRE